MSAEEAGSSQQQAGAGEPPERPSEEELRAAYEAELDRITSVEVMLQTVLSLLNLGMRRLGMLGGARPGAAEEDASAGQGPRRPGPAEASGRLWVPGR